MLVCEAIKEADRLKPNAFPTEDKLRWLERLERRVCNEILAHYKTPTPEVQPFGPEDMERELLVPEPYEEIYIHWLCAQMDYFEREPDSFNASNGMFEAVWVSFRNWYNYNNNANTKAKRYF